MPLPSLLEARLSLPVIAAPMFIVSTPDLVVAQCRAGIVGSLPALNARPQELLGDWLNDIRNRLADHDRAHPEAPAAPFAVNLNVHRTNTRLMLDLAVCVEHKVPIIITSLGVNREVIDAIHGYGGLVFHDVVNTHFARKAAEYGVDGLIAVAGGAGGHAGTINPIALLQDIKAFWQGTLILSGAMATGRAILAARVMGADLAYIGSAFLAAEEANAQDEYKQMVLQATSADVIYTPVFSGISANYLKPSIVACGLDPDNLPNDPAKLTFENGESPKVWKDIWGAGQGIGPVTRIEPTEEIVRRLITDYRAAAAEVETYV